MNRALWVATFAMGLCLANAQANGQMTCLGQDEAPEINSVFIDDFGGWHSIGKEAWLMGSSAGQASFPLCQVDNPRKYLVAQNSEANDFFAGKYSRFEWTESSGRVYYCQQVYDAESAADAMDFSKYPAADADDPNVTGCGKDGDFAWSQLIAVGG